MTIKERILFYLKENAIPREDFYKSTGLSASNFKGAALSSELGGDKIVRILTTYKTISPDWLLIGEGSMLRSDQTQPVVQSTPPGEDSFIYKMYNEEKAENKALIEEIGGLKERIRTLQSQLDQCSAPSQEVENEEESKGLDPAKDAFTKKPSSHLGSNAGSLGVPSGNI